MLTDPPLQYNKYNNFPKAKYQLKVYRNILYSFVTTSIPEEECINLLKERAFFHQKDKNMWYSIIKIIDGESSVIYKGCVPSFN